MDKEAALEAATHVLTTTDQNGAPIHRKPLKDGRQPWPKRELEIQRELLRSAPENGIDLDRLREALATMDDRAADRLIEMIAESGSPRSTTACRSHRKLV